MNALLCFKDVTIIAKFADHNKLIILNEFPVLSTRTHTIIMITTHLHSALEAKCNGKQIENIKS